MAWVNRRPLTVEGHLEAVEMERGRAVFTFDPPDSWRNPNGSLPGSMIASLSDHSAGSAAMSVARPGEYVSTVGLDIRYLLPAVRSPLRSTSTVVRRGRRLVFLHTEVHDAGGVLVAVGGATFHVDTPRGGDPDGPAGSTT